MPWLFELPRFGQRTDATYASSLHSCALADSAHQHLYGVEFSWTAPSQAAAAVGRPQPSHTVTMLG